jgi:hypothetical protein
MKLYIIVRSSLAAGLYAAQAVHAFWSFVQAYPKKTEAWAVDNNVIILQHDDLPNLADLLERAGLSLARFHEPDLNDELTAICVEPAARKHVSDLALAA